MQYGITFLEGIVSFISPCMLPLLPVYLSYFSGGSGEKRRTVLNALAFVLGFTVAFTLFGLFAGTLGGFLTRYRIAVRIVSGLIVIFFGLSYLEILPLLFFRGNSSARTVKGFFSAFVFGVVYSINLTPCVGAFLGSALMLASSSGGALQGTLLLLTYSLGLGVPFVLSAFLLDRAAAAFAFLKKHYKTVNLISGVFLILVGILMCFGLLDRLFAVFV